MKEWANETKEPGNINVDQHEIEVAHRVEPKAGVGQLRPGENSWRLRAMQEVGSDYRERNKENLEL
jgi:hypothetical protein